MVGLVIGVTACSDDDENGAGSEVERELQVTGTTSDFIVEFTPPVELQASVDPDFVANVLADGVVTADEMTDANQRYIECVADGGGAGIYAFDLDLLVMLHEWSLPSTAARNAAASLHASCSRDFLGDLFPRYKATNPGDADLAARQRERLGACVAAIDPTAAANIPDAIPVDTTGAGATGEDLQLDPTALNPDADAGQVEGIRRCIGAYGAEIVAFG